VEPEETPVEQSAAGPPPPAAAPAVESVPTATPPEPEQAPAMFAEAGDEPAEPVTYAEEPRVEPVALDSAQGAALLAAAAASPAAMGSVDTETAAAPQEAGAEPAEPVGTPEAPGSTAPNWMLAFVCAWAGATALNEAWAVLAPTGWKAEVLRSLGFLGYVLVGVGLLVFAGEALRWGGRKRSALAMAIPALMTLGGVVALILSQDPGRRI
jgi:hypothetical protein